MSGEIFANGKKRRSNGHFDNVNSDSVNSYCEDSDESGNSKKQSRKWTCWDRCLFYLSSREHSLHELEVKLKRAKHTPEEIEQSLKKLIEKDYLNEQRYFRSRVRQLILRRWGPQKIKAAIAKARVSWDDEVFREVQSEQGVQDQPEEQVRELIAKKLGTLSMQKKRDVIRSMNEGYEKRQALFSLKDKLLRSIASQGFAAFEYQSLIDEALESWFSIQD